MIQACALFLESPEASGESNPLNVIAGPRMSDAIWQEAENEAGPGGAGLDLRAPLLP